MLPLLFSSNTPFSTLPKPLSVRCLLLRNCRVGENPLAFPSPLYPFSREMFFRGPRWMLFVASGRRFSSPLRCLPSVTRTFQGLLSLSRERSPYCMSFFSIPVFDPDFSRLGYFWGTIFFDIIVYPRVSQSRRPFVNDLSSPPFSQSPHYS